MKLRYIFLFVFFSAVSFAQEGSSIPSTGIPRVDRTIPQNQDATSQYSISKPFVPTRFKTASKIYEAPKLEKSNTFNSPVSDLNPGKVKADKMNKSVQNTEGNNNIDFKIFRKDMVFGEYRTKSPSLTIKSRDFGIVDGDNIKIKVNNNTLLQFSSLEGFYKEFKIHLVEGINYLEIEALNEGSLSPNTGEFDIIQIDGKTLIKDVWYVATGFKAKFIIIKE